MQFQIDKGTGTGAEAKKISLVGKKSFLVIVAAVDGEIQEGFAASAENQVTGALETAGLDFTTCRDKYVFECSNDPTACVCYSINLGRMVEDPVIEEVVDVNAESEETA